MTERLNPHHFDKDLWEVLARYVAGESSSAEANAVRGWLAEDPRRAEVLSGLNESIDAWTATTLPDVDVEAALRKVSSRLHQADVIPLPERAPARWRTIGLAAAAALALAAGAT